MKSQRQLVPTAMTKTTSKTARQIGMKHGFRSGLEEQVGAELIELGVPCKFEEERIEYVVPARSAKYTPDFRLPDGSFVETKGRFVTEDRKKHLLIKEQHPHIKIRLLFNNPNSKISKRSKTTYAMWCEKHGFEYAKAATKAQRAKGIFSLLE